MSTKCKYLIIGCGVVGLAMARALKAKDPDAIIIMIDKEVDAALHASGRNSGVLHAGFYYTADSLKARFTVEGAQAWKVFCRAHQLPINECGKLVVARNEDERQVLHELDKRGKHNGAQVEIISEAQAKEIEPNVKTFKEALWSPTTASVDPNLCCQALKRELLDQGVVMHFNTAFIRVDQGVVTTSAGEFEPTMTINCAGLYADKIAQQYGFGHQYTMIPFKGLYLKYTKDKTTVKTNIYPVPNLNNPFLGVHYTKTVDGGIKIGPTATPALARENYEGLDGLKWNEFWEVMFYETKLFTTNAFNFRALAIEEVQKYYKKYFIGLAAEMVESIDSSGFTEWSKPGIRAQLLDKKDLKLVQDFVVEGDGHSIHVLNAVSPAFTCAFPFVDYVIKKFI